MPRLIIFALIVFSLAACSVIKKKGSMIEQPSDEIAYNITNAKVYNLTSYDFNIRRAVIELNNENGKQKLIANLKYRKPGNYLISMRNRTGIEAARIFISRDTILINDRINRKLFYGSAEFIKNKYGLSINAIPLLLGDYILDSASFSNEDKCINGKRSFTKLLEDRSISGKIDCSNFKILSAIFKDSKGRNEIIMDYSDFSKDNGIIFPRSINLSDGDGKLSLSIDLSDVELGVNDIINFIPGNGYEKVLLK